MSFQPPRSATPRMNRTQCDSCGAHIQFYLTKQGNWIPLDPNERSDGNIFIEDGKAVILRKGQAYTGLRYSSHFATCSDAEKWRKTR